MSLRSQSDRLAARGAAFRQTLAGIAAVWQGISFTAACTGISHARDPEPGGFELQPDATMRIPTALYPTVTPALGDKLTIGTTVVLVTKVTPMPLAGELRLELGKA